MAYETFEYGSVQVDPNQFKPEIINRLIYKAVAHVLGNEVASKVTGRVAGDKSLDNDESRESLKAAFQAEMLQKLVDGTIGLRSTGPKADPLEDAMWQVAKGIVVTRLKAHGLKEPKKDAVVRFADGRESTMDQMIERVLEREAANVKAEAEKVLRQRAKEKAAKEKALAALAGGTGLDSLA